MEQCKRIDGLPFLPGNTFRDPTVCDYRRSQTFFQKNGFFLPKNDYLGVGEVPIPAKTLSVKDVFDIYNYDPVLTYGEPKPKAPPPLVPAFVALEKKTLKFNAYYKESITDSAEENFRVRLVEIFYFLEDDTIMVNEPKIENSGIPQGKFLRRHRIPKNDIGETYHWKDLNVACDVMFYGRVFRIVDADPWTKQFYESEGLILNDPEILPKDPFTDKRYNALQKRTFHTPDVLCDSRKKYMEYGGKVLRFHCVWDEREVLYGSLRKFDLLYHLEDDMVEVVELQEPNCGRDPFKLFLHKTRLPKNWQDLPIQFPIISMELSKREIVEYYEPKDFKIGETLNVFGRRFLIFDMDQFTKQFYRDHFGYTDFTPICIDPPKPPPPPVEDPFADAIKGSEEGVQDGFVHIRIQQRNGRKTLTTVQGLSSEYDLKKIVRACKKEFACNGTVVEHPEYGEVLQLQGDQRENICQWLTKTGLAKPQQLKVHGF